VTHTIYLVAHLETGGGGGGTGNGWALLNLILAVITILTGIFALFAIRNRSVEGHEEKLSGIAVILRIAGFVIGIAAVIVFFLTEDLTQPIIFTDGWTPLMIVLFAIAAAVIALSFRFDDASRVLSVIKILGGEHEIVSDGKAFRGEEYRFSAGEGAASVKYRVGEEKDENGEYVWHVPEFDGETGEYVVPAESVTDDLTVEFD
jgi:hypothetical protein